MAPVPSLEMLDGRAVSWAEIAVLVNINGGVTLPIVGISAISSEAKIERGESRGASGGRVLARTTGQVTYSGTATFYAFALETLKDALSDLALASGYVNSDGHVQLSRISFDIIVTHDWVDDAKIYVRKYLGCHIDSESVKDEEGTDAKKIDVDLNPLRVVSVVNGKEIALL